MGGVVACVAVDREPEMFIGLALLSSPGVRRHAMLRRVPFSALSALLARPLVAVALTPLMRRMFALAGFSRYPDSALTRTIHGVGRTSIDEHAKRVRRLSLPTMLAWCDDDPIIESTIAAELANLCPAGPRLHFSHGGHNPQKTHAAEIGNAITRWHAELRAV
jgi:pimeloyl-ACP methyl ester carboxylesterase